MNTTTKMTAILLMAIILLSYIFSANALAKNTNAVSFVVQLTRSSENFSHRRVLLQIDKVLNDLGEKNLTIEVVAYESGIHALLAENTETVQLLTKLANRGVIFKACKISMSAWSLDEDDFPLEVEYVAAGAVEVIRLQMHDYKYWRP